MEVLTIKSKQMETETIITGLHQYEAMTNYKNLPEEIQRIHYHQGKIMTARYATRKSTDTHVYWSFSEAKPMFENQKLFFKRKSRAGATYDRAKKTIKLWFGQTIYNMPHEIKEDILNFFGCEWVLAMSHNLQSCVTLSLLNRIIKKKITNPRDFCKAYLRVSYFRTLNVSPEIFYNTFNNENARFLRHPQAYKNHFLYATEPENVFRVLVDNEKDHGGLFSSQFEDLVAQAAMLNKKYNPRWSDKRIKEVHDVWTKELMKIELEVLPIIEYDYKGKLPECDGVSLITNNRALFEEGKVMSHCIYTNYSSRVENKTYFAFKYDYAGKRATIGIKRHYNAESIFMLDQMYGYRNSNVEQSHKNRVQEWLNRKDVQDFFKANLKESAVPHQIYEQVAGPLDF